MDELIYNALDILFGKGVMNTLSGVMSSLLSLLVGLLSYDNSAPLLKLSMDIFGTLAVSFLTVAFFWRLISQGARGVITFEGVAGELIRLCLMMFILMNLSEILSLIMQFSKAVYDQLDTKWTSTIETAFGVKASEGGTLPFTVDDLSSFKSRFTFVDKILPCIISIFVLLLNLVCTAFGILFCVSNTIQVLICAVLAPLGVGACATAEHNDFGLKVLKRFLAVTLTMPVYALSLQVVPFLNTKILESKVKGLEGGITKDNCLKALDVGNVVYLVVPQLTTIGISSIATQITKETIGVI